MWFLRRVLVTALLLFTCSFANADINGGTTCAACSILVGLAEQLAQVHTTDIVTAVETYLCTNLPNPLNEACRALLNEFGSALIDGVYHNETPDIICHNIGLCTQEPGTEFCHAFPLPSNFDPSFLRIKDKSAFKRDKSDNPLCTLPGVKEICNIIDRFSNDHLPIEDIDRDKFSEVTTLRGTHWRGKDCDDTKSNFYPGRKPVNSDRVADSNCNGIYGVDPHSGIPFEEQYCPKAHSRGIAILGDSAGAHFHLPPEYFMAETLDEDTFQDVLMLLTDEFDWPQLSGVTAFTTNKWPHSIDGPVDSLYMRLLKDNKCIHRDYQNIAVNGGDSSNMHTIMKGLARNSTTDYPIIIVLALVGNDVCNGHPDTLAHMTSVKDYRSNMLTTLNYLNSTLPVNSTVIISGLADGRILWDTMHSRVHPIGQLNNDVTYRDLYEYLNCLQISPCTGWMNSNETIRNLTSKRAAELSQEGKRIVETQKYKSLDLIFMDYDVGDMISEWESKGGQAWQIIEPVDGFHPAQTGQALSAEHIYNLLVKNYPDVIGKINPHNSKISETFGNQGGY
ncbi:unnamed protein product [Clavelina lepadiformis]|uniref:Saposin B-type domain-containing protein n=1 Tax=Clavelina lepadiformis TaxID=159417 RepID=A0ABP0GT48_CLALP